MGETKEDICRLCLKCEGDTFVPLDEASKENLQVVVPELNLDTATNFVICSKCKVSLEGSRELTKTCSDTNQFIQTQIEKEKITDKVNLNRIVNKSSADTENVCRVCLKNKEANYKTIDTAKADDLFTTALETCLEELDVELTADPVICEECHNTLRDMYSFKTACLSVEDKLRHYCETTSESEIDLRKVLDFLKEESKNALVEDTFLSEFEVQDEEETDIFDIFPNFSGETAPTPANDENNKKRPLATEEEPAAAAKKPKKEVAEDELPHFNFNFNLIFNPKTDFNVEEWLAKVDELKAKFGWTDYLTIHKVLARLQGMEDLYTWFSGISEIMTWDEWKKKLIQMFPTQNDYYITLKRMFNRKKKPAEPYVSYYEAKLKLMEDLNLSPEWKVSCLIGGVTDVAVGCIARVGNYKNPEELLEYFKSCNDKKPSVTTPVKNDKPKDTNANKTSPQTSAAAKKAAKKRTQCFVCHKYGHASYQCWDTINKGASNGTTGKANPPKAGPKPKPRKRCIHCGNLGHASQICPLKRPSGLKPAAKPQSQAAKLAAPRSRFVGAQEKKPAKPQPKQKKETGRCHYCGKMGHMQRNCRNKPASLAGGISSREARLQERNEERYRELLLDRLQEETSRIVCFKCFRVGHDARDCMEYGGGRAFRN